MAPFDEPRMVTTNQLIALHMKAGDAGLEGLPPDLLSRVDGGPWAYHIVARSGQAVGGVATCLLLAKLRGREQAVEAMVDLPEDSYESLVTLRKKLEELRGAWQRWLDDGC